MTTPPGPAQGLVRVGQDETNSAIQDETYPWSAQDRMRPTQPSAIRIALLVHNRLENDPRVSRHAYAAVRAGYRVAVLSVGASEPDQARWGVAVNGVVVYESRILRASRLGRLRALWQRRLAGRAADGQNPVTNGAGDAAAVSPGPAGGPRGAARDLWTIVMLLRNNVGVFRQFRGLGARLVHANDLNVLLAGYLLARAWRAPLLYDSHELWTQLDESWSPLLRRLFALVEGPLLRRADAVVTVNAPIARELARAYGAPLPDVVMNCPELPSPSPDEQPHPEGTATVNPSSRVQDPASGAGSCHDLSYENRRHTIEHQGARCRAGHFHRSLWPPGHGALRSGGFPNGISVSLAQTSGVASSPHQAPLSAAPVAPVSHTQPETAMPLSVVYQGMLNYRGRGLEGLIDAAAQVDGVTLTLRGPGSLATALQQRIDERRAHNVRMLPPVPMADLVRALDGYDVGVVAYLPLGKNFLYCSPNKLFEYMMAGLAVVCSDLPVLREVVVAADCGLLYEPGNVDALAATLRRLAADRALLARYRANARRAALERYNATQEEGRLMDLYARLIASRPSGSCRK